jgi:hypothetical protein
MNVPAGSGAVNSIVRVAGLIPSALIFAMTPGTPFNSK